MKLAINQPYLAPYSGYYSLINSADVFVFYDCVQFIRRGRIHRSQIHKSASFADGWLTLPVEKAPQETRIMDMALKPLSNAEFTKTDWSLIRILSDDFDLGEYMDSAGKLSDFLYAHLTSSCRRLGIETEIIRSSQLAIDRNLTGPDRITDICKKLGADLYLNLPGGRSLYDAAEFARQGVQLKFLDTSSCGRLGYLQAIAEGRLAQFQSEAVRDLIAAV